MALKYIGFYLKVHLTYARVRTIYQIKHSSVTYLIVNNSLRINHIERSKKIVTFNSA